jgi:xylan 1,4-beta-xylosidase
MLLERSVRALSAATALIVFPFTAGAQAPAVAFDWFEYTGHDAVFASPQQERLQAASPQWTSPQAATPTAPRPRAASPQRTSPRPHGTYRNPILAGFYPDPSITRAGERFYLVNSTFTYFPGIPVFESTDLVHWRQIGSVIDRPTEISFNGLSVSRGLFAPAIAFHEGVFYVIDTAVDAGGNFIATTRDPAGPWSDPIWLPQLDGAIDPSLFFDADGKTYVLNNGPPPGKPLYEGHRAIWIQQLDLSAHKLIGPRKVLVNGGVSFANKPVWIEGPHLYRHGGWYYLMCAEGGTGPQHSEVVLRSHSPWGPFEPFANNPILTQRDLPADRPDPIANAGHADLVEAPDGSWWAVFLASRIYDKVHYNTGRETYLLRVTWHNGWPVILDHGKTIPYTAPAPALPNEEPDAPPTTGNFTWRDEFDSTTPRPEWLYVRVPDAQAPWLDLQSRPGWLTIRPARASLDTLGNPSFLARRQQHLSFHASTALELPTVAGVAAGLAAFQNESFWYFFGVRHTEAGPQLFLEKRGGQETVALGEMALKPRNLIKLRISGNAGRYSFFYDEDRGGWKPFRENDDAIFLSTDVAGGFVGAVIGPYARAE